MLVNIHFNNTNSKKIAELYLFYRLREFSAKFGGSFKNFEFTKHEKHGTLPKLIALGWVTTDYKVSKYRNLVKKYSGSWANMDLTYLESLNKFKGFIIASLESSQLRSTWRRQNNKAKCYSSRDKRFVHNDWVEGGRDQRFFKVKKIEKNAYSGRTFNSSLSKLAHVSINTISRWRKYSSNTYKLSSISSSYPDILGRGIDKIFRTKDLSYITKDLLIHSNIDVFTSSFFNKNFSKVSKS